MIRYGLILMISLAGAVWGSGSHFRSKTETLPVTDKIDRSKPFTLKVVSKYDTFYAEWYEENNRETEDRYDGILCEVSVDGVSLGQFVLAQHWNDPLRRDYPSVGTVFRTEPFDTDRHAIPAETPNAWFSDVFILTEDLEPLAVYSWSSHKDEEGKPSRDDRRYRSGTLSLYEYGLFRIVNQTGYLSPEYETLTGFWYVSEDRLLLDVRGRDGADGSVLLQRIPLKRVKNHTFDDGTNRWKYDAGLRPEELADL